MQNSSICHTDDLKFNVIPPIFNLQLPSNTTWQTLRDQFGEVGDIKFAEMRGKDVGIIRFSNDNEASRAVGILFLQLVHISTRK